MSHPLLDVDRIDGPPGPFLASIGEVFARFGMHTQDSGNESYGLHIGDRRFFVKTTDPDVEVYCNHSAASSCSTMPPASMRVAPTRY